MSALTNSVYQFWSRPPRPWAPPGSYTKQELRSVRARDIEEANQDLLDLLNGHTKTERDEPDLQRLGALNLSLATARRLRDTLVEACATTLVRLCARHPLMSEDVLIQLHDALSRTDAAAMGWEGYRACMHAADAFFRSGHRHTPQRPNRARSMRALKNLRIAQRVAERMDADTGPTWARALAKVHQMRGEILSGLGQLKEGGAAFGMAWEVARQENTDSGELAFTISKAWAEACSANEQSDLAIQVLKTAIPVVAACGGDAQPRNARMAELNWSVGGLYFRTGQRKKAAEWYQKALRLADGLADDGGVWARPNRNDILADLSRTGYRSSAVEQFQKQREEVLYTKGIREAAFLDHPGARSVHLLGRLWMPDPEPECVGAVDTTRHLSPQDRRLLRILNADRVLLKRRIDGLTGEPRRTEEAQLLACLRPLLRPRLAQYYRCVSILQRIADQICHVEPGRNPCERRIWEGPIMFSGFALEEVRLFSTVLDRGRSALYAVEAIPPNAEEGTWKYLSPGVDPCVELGPDEEVYLCVSPWDDVPDYTMPEDGWVAEAFLRLMGSAYSGDPKLRQCHRRPPPGCAGVQVAGTLICGTFYISPGKKACCWNPTCEG